MNRPPDSLDSETVDRLYAACGDTLTGFVVRLVGDRELATEVVQHTFARLLERGGETRPDKRRGWLFRVAYHEAMRIRRREQVERRARPRMARSDISPTAAPETLADRRELIEKVRESPAGLTDEQRVVVQKRISEEKTFAVIAAELNVPLGTVVSRMRAAMATLARSLDAD